jgi:hypothetical protein
MPFKLAQDEKYFPDGRRKGRYPMTFGLPGCVVSRFAA